MSFLTIHHCQFNHLPFLLLLGTLASSLSIEQQEKLVKVKNDSELLGQVPVTDVASTRKQFKLKANLEEIGEWEEVGFPLPPLLEEHHWENLFG